MLHLKFRTFLGVLLLSKQLQYAKLSICVEESDETQFWLEMLGEAGIVAENRLTELKQEYLEIVSVLGKARSTHKDNG